MKKKDNNRQKISFSNQTYSRLRKLIYKQKLNHKNQKDLSIKVYVYLKIICLLQYNIKMGRMLNIKYAIRSKL